MNMTVRGIEFVEVHRSIYYRDYVSIDGNLTLVWDLGDGWRCRCKFPDIKSAGKSPEGAVRNLMRKAKMLRDGFDRLLGAGRGEEAEP